MWNSYNETFIPCGSVVIYGSYINSLINNDTWEWGYPVNINDILQCKWTLDIMYYILFIELNIIFCGVVITFDIVTPSSF